MSLKSILKVANYYNVKYAFGSESFEEDSESESSSKITRLKAEYLGSKEEKILDDGQISYDAIVKFVGEFEGSNFELVDVYYASIYPKGEPSVSDSGFEYDDEKKYILKFDGLVVNSENLKLNPRLKALSDSFREYTANQGVDELNSALNPIKDEIFDLDSKKNEGINIALENELYEQAQEREEQANPLGVRGLSSGDFYPTRRF